MIPIRRIRILGLADVCNGVDAVKKALFSRNNPSPDLMRPEACRLLGCEPVNLHLRKRCRLKHVRRLEGSQRQRFEVLHNGGEMEFVARAG